MSFPAEVDIEAVVDKDKNSDVELSTVVKQRPIQVLLDQYVHCLVHDVLYFLVGVLFAVLLHFGCDFFHSSEEGLRLLNDFVDFVSYFYSKALIKVDRLDNEEVLMGEEGFVDVNFRSGSLGVV